MESSFLPLISRKRGGLGTPGLAAGVWTGVPCSTVPLTCGVWPHSGQVVWEVQCCPSHWGKRCLHPQGMLRTSTDRRPCLYILLGALAKSGPERQGQPTEKTWGCVLRCSVVVTPALHCPEPRDPGWSQHTLSLVSVGTSRLPVTLLLTGSATPPSPSIPSWLKAGEADTGAWGSRT